MNTNDQTPFLDCEPSVARILRVSNASVHIWVYDTNFEPEIHLYSPVAINYIVVNDKTFVNPEYHDNNYLIKALSIECGPQPPYEFSPPVIPDVNHPPIIKPPDTVNNELLFTVKQNQNDFQQGFLTVNEKKCPFHVQQIGEQASGQPMVIAMHGGGGCPVEVNDQQYEHMKVYYSGYLIQKNVNCLYVAVRGISDVWDLNHRPEHSQLIPLLVLMCHHYHYVDSNRVSLVGFSAGGDGAHMTGSDMADRFSFVSASAGHPNGASYLTRINVSSWIQVGQYDGAYGRNAVAVECATQCVGIASLYTQMNAKLLVHSHCWHNFNDQNDTSLVMKHVSIANLDEDDQEDIDTIPTCCNPALYGINLVRNTEPVQFYCDFSNMMHSQTRLKFSYNICVVGSCKLFYERIGNEIRIDTAGSVEKVVLLLRQNEPISVMLNGHQVKVEVKQTEVYGAESCVQRMDQTWWFPFEAVVLNRARVGGEDKAADNEPL